MAYEIQVSATNVIVTSSSTEYAVTVQSPAQANFTITNELTTVTITNLSTTASIYTDAVELVLANLNDFWRGQWTTGTYVRGDIVVYENSQYFLKNWNVDVLAQYTSTIVPPDDSTWQQFNWHEAPFKNLTVTNTATIFDLNVQRNLTIGGGAGGNGLVINSTATFNGQLIANNLATFNGTATFNSDIIFGAGDITVQDLNVKGELWNEEVDIQYNGSPGSSTVTTKMALIKTTNTSKTIRLGLASPTQNEVSYPTFFKLSPAFSEYNSTGVFHYSNSPTSWSPDFRRNFTQVTTSTVGSLARSIDTAAEYNTVGISPFSVSLNAGINDFYFDKNELNQPTLRKPFNGDIKTIPLPGMNVTNAQQFILTRKGAGNNTNFVIMSPAGIESNSIADLYDPTDQSLTKSNQTGISYEISAEKGVVKYSSLKNELLNPTDPTPTGKITVTGGYVFFDGRNEGNQKTGPIAWLFDARANNGSAQPTPTQSQFVLGWSDISGGYNGSNYIFKATYNSQIFGQTPFVYSQKTIDIRPDSLTISAPWGTQINGPIAIVNTSTMTFGNSAQLIIGNAGIKFANTSTVQTVPFGGYDQGNL